MMMMSAGVVTVLSKAGCRRYRPAVVTIRNFASASPKNEDRRDNNNNNNDVPSPSTVPLRNYLELRFEELRRRASAYLLEQLDGVDAAQARRSVGEAVVAAREEETRRNEARWEERKDELRREAEEAALERIATDMVSSESEASDENSTATDVHPVLGPTVADLGYKRVYCTSVRNLKTVPVWERQRAYRHDRALAMAKDKARNKRVGLPGIIALFEDRNGALSILDGQHRVGMMTILQDENPRNRGALDPDRILVEVFSETEENDSSSSSSSSLAKHLFAEINKAEPVQLIDMPDDDDDENKSKRRAVVDGAAERLRKSFPEMFKPSQRCRSPHLNVDNLRESLFASDALLSVGDSDALYDWIMERNEELKKKHRRAEGKKGKDASKAVEKARKYDFYLGLESSWLEILSTNA